MQVSRENLITARTDAGMTQRELAGRLGVSQPYLAAFESGTKPWPDRRIKQAHDEIEFFATQHRPEERASYLDQFRALIESYHAGELEVIR